MDFVEEFSNEGFGNEEPNFEELRNERAGSSVETDEIKQMKAWMFQEQIRIQAKQDELEDLNRELQKLKKSLEADRDALELKEKMIRKRFDDNEAFISKKLKIIENAYQQLAVDRKSLECERLNFEHEKSKYRRQKMSGLKAHQYDTCAYDGTSFFRGVDSELALRKRYKELLKIFHPDNKCGDTKTLLLIQTEYEKLRSQYYEV